MSPPIADRRSVPLAAPEGGGSAGTRAHGRTGPADASPERTRITLTVNGKRYPLHLDNRTTLLDVLREELRLTGSKKGCDHGQCGACTVTVNGERVNSCLCLAVMHDGDAVETIEGVGTPDRLDPMQAAFLAHDAFQCGYCTPGQIASARAVIEEVRGGIPSHVTEDLTGRIELTDAEIRERMSGNICRCGAYANILAAITEVAENISDRSNRGGEESR